MAGRAGKVTMPIRSGAGLAMRVYPHWGKVGKIALLATKHAGRSCWGFLPIPQLCNASTAQEKGRKWLSLRKPDRSKRHDEPQAPAA